MISEKLRIVIERSGLTLTEISNRSNVSRIQLHRYLNDEVVPTLQVLRRLAECFNISVADLIDNDLTDDELALLITYRHADESEKRLIFDFAEWRSYTD